MPSRSSVKRLLARKKRGVRNLVVALVLALLAVAWAVWQHSYGGLVVLAVLALAFPFFLWRARNRT
jgi:hypothetical protein